MRFQKMLSGFELLPGALSVKQRRQRPQKD
jgi:hypothetical protein